MSDAPRYLLTAAEPLGDAIGAALIRSLRARQPNAIFEGCGGPLMQGEGLTSFFPIEKLSVIGPVDAVSAITTAFSGARLLTQKASENFYSAAIFIDSWTFSVMAAKRVRKAAPSLPLIKYVAPQFWASRPQRTKVLASLFDGVLSLFEFEAGPIKDAGGNVRFVGNPIYQAAYEKKSDGTAFRDRHEIGGAPLLVVLPGSRRGEVTPGVPGDGADGAPRVRRGRPGQSLGQLCATCLGDERIGRGGFEPGGEGEGLADASVLAGARD